MSDFSEQKDTTEFMVELLKSKYSDLIIISAVITTFLILIIISVILT